MTFGEELLDELGRLLPIDSYLNAGQQEQLKQVESKDDLQEFLDKNGMRDVATSGDVPDIAGGIAFSMNLDRASKVVDRAGCVGFLLVPFVLQEIWIVNAVKMRRLRFSIAEMLAFVALFAACLSYEVSIAPALFGMPQQLLLALPVAVLLGALPSFLFKTARWIVVSIDTILVMEAVAFVA